MPKLALLGGEKIRKTKFPPYFPLGKEELNNVQNVFDSHVFSRFLGCWHDDFYGGKQVRAVEEEWADYFNVKHAISVNSATSALYAAVGAIGVEPFDEVIVTPYSMSASAVAPLIYNAIPVFADIEEDYFCLDVKSIEKQITPQTKAIIVVDLFGLAYDRTGINALAQKYGLKVIEDCAQAPHATHGDQYAGTLGDIGIYSFNYHKHIHCGEGGMLVTNDDELAERLRLIRNHAEAVVESKGYDDLVNMIGNNHRMTEIDAAIIRSQLKKLPDLVSKRKANVAYLDGKLNQIPCLQSAKVRNDCSHAYYVHPLKFDQNIAGVHRNKFIDAVKAELMPIENRETEGVSIGCGYVKPLYLQPLFQKKIAYGSKGFPWSHAVRDVNYDKGLCPVCEQMHDDILITHELIHPAITSEDLDDVMSAFEKVWENRSELYE
jgi:dTDP-4-amino-4,6-dideoxygalactose transaminase